MQSRVPVNARTCKHLKTLLGDKYEEARVKLKDPEGSSKGSSKKKPAPKAAVKSPMKRKKAVDVDDEDEDDVKPVKRARKPASAAKGNGGNGLKVDADEEDDEAAIGDEDKPISRGKNVPELLLAVKWDIEKGTDPTGWWISEKLDGVRFVTLIL
jgi:DNA ligase-1